MRVRPFASEDADAVRAILDATYSDDRWVRSLHEGSHGLPVDRPHFRRSSLVAELDGVVVAAGTISYRQRHPTRSSVAIDVAPASRRRGVGTALLEAARARRAAVARESATCGRGGTG